MIGSFTRGIIFPIIICASWSLFSRAELCSSRSSDEVYDNDFEASDKRRQHVRGGDFATTQLRQVPMFRFGFIIYLCCRRAAADRPVSGVESH